MPELVHVGPEHTARLETFAAVRPGVVVQDVTDYAAPKRHGYDASGQPVVIRVGVPRVDAAGVPVRTPNVPVTVERCAECGAEAVS